MTDTWAGEMVHWVKVLASKPDNLHSVLGSHVMEEMTVHCLLYWHMHLNRSCSVLGSLASPRWFLGRSHKALCLPLLSLQSHSQPQ